MRCLFVIFFVFIIGVSAFAGNDSGQASQAVSYETLAILDLKPIGVTQSDADAISENLRTEFISAKKYKIIERDMLNKILEEQKLQSSGLTEEEGAVNIGKLAGAKYITVGSLSKVNNTYTINVRLISVESGEALVAQSVNSDNADNLPEMCHKLVALILGIKDNSLSGSYSMNNTPSQGNGDQVYNTQLMIRNGSFLGKGGVEKLRTSSSGLDYSEKELIDKDNEKTGWWGCLDIWLPSLGNWIEGDYVGGTVSVVGFAGGYAIAAVGVASYSEHPADSSLIVIGSLILTAAYIYGPVSCFVFANDYNTKLKDGLELADYNPERNGGLTASQNPRYLNGYTGTYNVNLFNYRF